MRRINDCFDKQLAAIYQKIIGLKHLNTVVNEFLPESLQHHCQVTQFNQGRLSIGVNDVSLATELRFFLPTLRDLLRQKAKLHQLTSLNISVITPPLPSHNSSKKGPKSLSAAAHLAISEAGKSCAYEPLKQAWEQMQKTADRKVPTRCHASRRSPNE
ncbi:MAG: hypothetical protein A3F46_07855 [Legionellales bacterium RIFCSPHIGHO2_12_FULL_42_9]|nr:MAG: hypothetical protein A3F46_07855 [Legionellales bacterium RIFCSPHIGHO2_12_FULL_42_9]